MISGAIPSSFTLFIVEGSHEYFFQCFKIYKCVLKTFGALHFLTWLDCYSLVKSNNCIGVDIFLFIMLKWSVIHSIKFTSDRTETTETWQLTPFSCPTRPQVPLQLCKTEAKAFHIQTFGKLLVTQWDYKNYEHFNNTLIIGGVARCMLHVLETTQEIIN